MWATRTGPLAAGSASQNQHLEALHPSRPASPTGPSPSGPGSGDGGVATGRGLFAGACLLGLQTEHTTYLLSCR